MPQQTLTKAQQTELTAGHTHPHVHALQPKIGSIYQLLEFVWNGTVKQTSNLTENLIHTTVTSHG